MMELDAPDKTRLSHSAALAALIWLVILVLFVVVPVVRTVPEDREFPEVRIVLQSAVQEPVKQSAQKADETPARRSAPADTVRERTEPATPTREQPASGLGIPDFQSASGNTRTAPASGEYLDFSSERPREQQLRDSAPAIQEFEGSAAQVDQSPARPGTATTEAGRRASAASDETIQALDQIRDGRSGAVPVPADTASGNTAAPTANSAQTAPTAVGPITFDGTPRRLIHPAKPVIILPPHLARLIDSDRTVTVHFLVRADGTVPASLITFSPSALLPPEIQNYLRNEFMNWRFERGRDDGQARFLYSITVQ